MRVAGVIGVVLAGGRSRRFGRVKSLELLAGERLIDRQIRTLRAVFAEVVVIANDADPSLAADVTVCPDLVPGRGPLAGLHAALVHGAGASVFVTACDMPFVQLPLVRRLVELAAGVDVAVPRRGHLVEPLLGVYSPACLPHVQRMLEAGELRVVGFFPLVRTAYIETEEIRRLDPHGLSFFNVNTPEDMARAREMLARSGAAGDGG